MLVSASKVQLYVEKSNATDTPGTRAKVEDSPLGSYNA
jgi:hypothetical protein